MDSVRRLGLVTIDIHHRAIGVVLRVATARVQTRVLLVHVHLLCLLLLRLLSLVQCFERAVVDLGESRLVLHVRH